MPESGIGSVLGWLSEATLAGLCVFILYGSYKKLWYWCHYVDELRADKDFWKHMALELIKSNRTLVSVEEQRGHWQEARAKRQDERDERYEREKRQR